MKKKTSKNVQKYSLIYIFALTGLVTLVGGCTSPKILENRGNVPPASLTPPPDANEIVSSTTQSDNNAIDIVLPKIGSEQITISNEDLNKGDFDNFPEVKEKSIEYKVKKGDSFWKIARMYGVGMRELAAYNNMDIKKPLNAGKVIQIPPGGKLVKNTEIIPLKNISKPTAPKTITPKPAASKQVVAKVSDAKNGVYTVKPGDSLWLIARMHDTNVDKLTKANGINKNTPLKVGQKIILPKGSAKSVDNVVVKPKTTPVADNQLSQADNDMLNDLIGNTDTNESSDTNSPIDIATDSFLPHTVKDGDTWNTISEMYGVSVSELKKSNPKIASEKEPAIGSVVNIPEG